MSANRFEKVSSIQADALTLELFKDGEKAMGCVHVPAAISNGKVPQDIKSGSVEAKQAFRHAVKLANDMKAPMVVMDAGGVWDGAWGELYDVEE